MTFEELREVEHGSVLIDEEIMSLYKFLGFTPSGKYIEVDNSNEDNLGFYEEYEIKDWKLKPKEREFEILEWYWYPLSKTMKIESDKSFGHREIVDGKEGKSIKVKGAKRFKHYLDNGEVEVINE